mgnify:FL=1
MLAVQTLIKTSNGSYSNLQVSAVIESSSMNDADKRLFTTIVYGVIQHKLTLEYQLSKFLKDPKDTQNWVKELLYTAMFQMEYLDRVPNRAIFDESIKIAKKLGNDGTRRFVTGVLHQIDRQGFPDPRKIDDSLLRTSIEYSIPEWLINLLAEQLGIEKTISILKSLNTVPKQSVRVNNAKISKEELVSQLHSAGFDVSSSQVSKSGLIIEGGNVLHSKFFEEGLLTPQDESAMLPVEEMNVQESDTVLDACSAPGGKTTQIAASLDSGKVVALDIHEKKLKIVQKNAARLGVSDKVETIALDARKVGDKFADNYFDKILVDAPCSGLGLMRRKPEIRYEKKLSDIQKLENIQEQILDSVAKKVKTGGTITYSTCTIVNQENQQVIEKFLKHNSNFEIAPVSKSFRLKSSVNSGMIKIYPDDFDSDGFFVCSLVRKS